MTPKCLFEILKMPLVALKLLKFNKSDEWKESKELLSNRENYDRGF